ncbi:MAG: hypothetical protein HZB18_08230 [Chloroflexi bacterium]|nr:hypothetical protein [Chloroflexota bacterium]
MLKIKVSFVLLGMFWGDSPISGGKGVGWNAQAGAGKDAGVFHPEWGMSRIYFRL